jgi:hypothetical protein
MEDLYVAHSHLRIYAALKNPVLFQIFFFFSFKFITQLFVPTHKCFQKKKFFDPENIKKTLLIIGPKLFLCTGPAAQTVQK